MTWAKHHSDSEGLAGRAESAVRSGCAEEARRLYALAADAEDRGLAALDGSKSKTIGVSAVSAAWLWYRAGLTERAEQSAQRSLTNAGLPEFARAQLRELLGAGDRGGPGRPADLEA
jgi:hypothetical protein